MMNEVKVLRTGQQKDSLMKVFTWFKANKHTLHSGPHFGKSYQLKEASDVVKKAQGSTRQSSPRRSKVVTTQMAKEEEEKQPVTRLESAEGMRTFFQSVTPSTQLNDPETPKNLFNLDLPSNKDYVNEYLTSRFFQAGEISGFGQPSTLDTPSNRAYMNDQVPSERTVAMERFINSPSLYDGPDVELQRLASSLGDVDEGHTELHPLPQEDGRDSVESQRYIESVTVDSHYQDEDDEGFEIDESGPADIDMELPDIRRKLSREQTATTSFRAAMSAPTHGDQFSNLSTYIPKKMVHPIASLVNPHAQLAAMEAKRAEEEYQASRENTSLSHRILSRSSSAVPKSSATPQIPTFRPVTAISSHPESLTHWKSYNKDMSYGQEILRDLSFVGRSGTAMDVRYTAHDFGEMPEEMTKHVVAFFSQNSKSVPVAKVLTPRTVEVQELYTQSSLEDFYAMADNLYPRFPKYRKPVYSKPRSAASSRMSDTPEKTSRHAEKPKFHPLGKQLLDAAEAELREKENKPPPEPASSVKLDAVVQLVDDVSENMTYFKERLAPAPSPGFRQPSSSTVSRRPLSRPATATGHRSPSPMQRSNSPDIMSERPRPHTSFSHNNPPPGVEFLEPHPPMSARSGTPSRTAEAIDWRGKIIPETERTKWLKAKFGDHTYVQKMKGKRPVGATHAGKRPKTAPQSFQDRWKMEKESNTNTRVESQAATNTMTEVDPKVMESVMRVQPIENWNTGMGSMSSIFLDDDFLRSFSGSRHTGHPSTDTNTPVPMEYVPIVSSAPRSLSVNKKRIRFGKGSRAQSRQTRSRSDTRAESQIDEIQDEETTCDDQQPANREAGEPVVKDNQYQGNQPEPDQAQQPTVHFQTPDIQEDYLEGRQDLGEVPGVGTVNIDDQGRIIGIVKEDDNESVSTTTTLDQDHIASRQPIRFHTEDLHNGNVHIEVTAVPSAGRAPTPQELRQRPIQALSKSDTWNYAPDVEQQEVDTEKYLPGQRKPQTPNIFQKGDIWYKTIVKPENYCFECLPDSMSTKVGRSAGRMPGRPQSVSSQVLRMARKQNEYFKKAPPVRTPPSIPSPYHHTSSSPRYGETYNSGLEHHARKVKSPRHFMEHGSNVAEFVTVVDLRKETVSAPPGSLVTREDSLMESLQVCRLSTRGSNTEGLEGKPTEEGEMMDDNENKRVTFREESESSMEGKKSTFSKSSSYSQISMAHIGRPIAQVSRIPDPDEEAAAAKTQFEAKAAVDIQRIFRGYVARNVYKKLLRDERERLEDECKAAVEIQRRYRGHLIRKKEIYQQTGLKKEHLEWASDFKQIKNENEARRQKKMEALSENNTLNYQRSSTRLSTIGPHVDIYQIYHPKQTGPTKKDMFNAATHIQRYIRGFLIRKRFERLKRKCVWLGSTYNKMVKDYKGMLRKCQLRHGVDRPKTPFSIQDMMEYLEMRRRYESVFDKKAFGSELEVIELESFFKECDMYPSASEIDEAIDVVFHGQQVKRGLLKPEVMELVFYIYTPKATGLPNNRQSTWLNPIIDGVEAKKLIANATASGNKKGQNKRSEYVEKAPLEVCAKLVIESRRERREKERKEKDQKLTDDLAQMKAKRDEEAAEKKKVVIVTPEEAKQAISRKQ
eukprot:XP_011421859.1 PREDICTED: uncharacterized protein LOC105324435 isoform X8 [Crassostrea gigas]